MTLFIDTLLVLFYNKNSSYQIILSWGKLINKKTPWQMFNDN